MQMKAWGNAQDTNQGLSYWFLHCYLRCSVGYTEASCRYVVPHAQNSEQHKAIRHRGLYRPKHHDQRGNLPYVKHQREERSNLSLRAQHQYEQWWRFACLTHRQGLRSPNNPRTHVRPGPNDRQCLDRLRAHHGRQNPKAYQALRQRDPRQNEYARACEYQQQRLPRPHRQRHQRSA